jgi:hypothetical protein
MPRRPRLALLLLAASAVLAVPPGCATSAQFQHAAALAVPHLAADAAAYVTADTSLDPGTRAARLQQAAALATATAAAASVTDQGVYAAWVPVSGWYRAYVNADAAIPAGYRTAKLGRAAWLDKLIADEAKRPLGASTRPVAG